MAFDLVGATLSFATFFGIYALLALSLNFQYGIAGLPNFGQVLFYGIGAYASGVISSTLIMWALSLNVANYCNVLAQGLRMTSASNNAGLAVGASLLGIVAAALLAALFGFILSYPAVRIQEEWYLALVLLIAGEVIRTIVRNYSGFGGVCGISGLGGVPSPFQWISNVTEQYFSFTIFVLGLVAIAYFYFQRTLNSPYGRMLKSIRDDDIAARTLGKNVTRARIQVMVIGSAFAGVAGALFTYYSNYVVADNFIPVVTFNVWVMIVLGGLGNNKGALLGTLIVTFLQKLLSIMAITIPIANAALVLNYSVYVIEGVIFILLLIYKPKGLLVEEPVKTPANIVLESE